jgi:hypothetical protein
MQDELDPFGALPEWKPPPARPLELFVPLSLYKDGGKLSRVRLHTPVKTLMLRQCFSVFRRERHRARSTLGRRRRPACRRVRHIARATSSTDPGGDPDLVSARCLRRGGAR